MRFSTDNLRQRYARLQKSLPANLVQRFFETDLLTHAAALSFYTLLSLAPLLVVLLWITASLYPTAQQQLTQQIGSLAGSDARLVVDTIIANAQRQPSLGSLTGLWGTLLLLVGATAVFARLQTALNLIFHSDAQHLSGILAWLRKRVLSFGVVLSLGFMLLVSMTLTTALQVFFARLPAFVPVLGTLLTFVVYALAFAFLYHYLPDRRVRWRQALLGGVVTAGLFILGRWLIGLYIAQAAPGSAYGSMGALVLLLVWVYYAAAVFFIGALITAVIDERAHKRRAASAPPAMAS